MKTVVFLLGVPDRNVYKTKSPISEADFDMINDVATRLDVAAEIMFAVPDDGWAGRAKDVPIGKWDKKAERFTPGSIRSYREKVMMNIGHSKPDVVVACGPVALKCLMNKGTIPLKEHLREDLDVPELPDATCVATHSMEMIAVKPGMNKWVMLDVSAALHGRTATKWGKYKVLMPGHPAWAKMPKELVGKTDLGLDLETYPGLSEWHPEARIRMMVISDKVGRAWIVQARKDSKFPAWVRSIVENPGIRKGGSNIKFDYAWLLRFGYQLENMFDTSTAEHVLDCTNPLTDLKSLTFIYCAKLGDYSKKHRALVKERGGWEYITDAEQYQYCGGDGEASIAAMKGQTKRLKQEGLDRPFALSMGLYRVLAGMEARGACVDMAINTELDQKFEADLTQLRQQITDVLGPINPNSPDQLAHALVEAVPDIQINKPKLTRLFRNVPYQLRKGTDPLEEMTTDKETLEREAHRHQIIETLLVYRRYAKLHGTYVKGLRDKHAVIHPDGQYYIHTSYRTDVVETYRLSSQGPNLQNTPRKPDPDDAHPIPLDLNIKRQFISRFEGGHIMEGDLAAAEVRWAAELSGDVAMIEALAEEDPHRALTARFKGKRQEDVTTLERTHGKRTTFLVIYGGGARTLGLQLGISKTAGKALLDDYFGTFTGLRDYIALVKEQVRYHLYSDSIFGYRRRFKEPPSWNQWEGWRVERQAWNHQVQNAAACTAFIAMTELERLFIMHRLSSVIVMQVHDSIVVDTYPGEEHVVAGLLRVCLERPPLHEYGVEMQVPLVADIEIGTNWGDKKDFVVGEW